MLWKQPSGSPSAIFGSFQLTACPQPNPTTLTLNNNQSNNIIGLADQSGVTINGMSVNSATGIITLNTSGLYLLNASFKVTQTSGAGGLTQSHLFVTNPQNGFIFSVSEFIDEQTSGDTYRTLTLSGHAVIVATDNFQFRLRIYQGNYINGIAIMGGNNRTGVSILKIS